MSGFTLKINSMDNAAFADGNAAVETARILREVATRLESGHESGLVREINGNTVGQWDIDPPEPEDD